MKLIIFAILRPLNAMKYQPEQEKSLFYVTLKHRKVAKLLPSNDSS